jgi:hypothetical protein
MTKAYGTFLGAIVALAPGAFGQTPQSAGIVYQQAGAFSAQIGPPGATTIAISGAPGPGIVNLGTVTGSPFSGAQESHSLQILGDGTRIERTEESQYYRDSQGRTRVESGPAGSGRITIQDPVGGFMATLDPASRTAQKMPAPQLLKTVARGQVTKAATLEARSPGAGNVFFAQGAMGAALAGPVTVRTGSVDAMAKPALEDLGTQNLGGVTAGGQRTTLTIPAGDIGNDRPIHVVGETWYSNDLQLVVKSSNSDPRFGDTTYSLTNINRAEPDPTLFQIPADYAISEPTTMKLKTVAPKE